MSINHDIRAERATDSIDVENRAPAITPGSAASAQQQKLHKPPVLLFLLPLVLLIIYAYFSR
jgi:hypothetical protein